MKLRFSAPSWGSVYPWGLAFAVALLCVTVAVVGAQPRTKVEPVKTAPLPGDKPGDVKDLKIDPKTKKPKTFDFTALDLNGRMRSPQLLYFLERANEELERASLEKRSFIPHMVRSLEEEQL